MIKVILAFLIFIYAASTPGAAQQAHYKDSIELVSTPLGGFKFYQHDKRLTVGQLISIMRPNAEAFKYLIKAKTNNTIAFITGLIEGFLIGYEIGNAIGGRQINWGVMGTGAGVVVIGIPFDIGAKRNARKAVYLYNAAFR